ncbi:MAG: DegT/DnrJ/EryC1/StrS family aminotransferase [Actinobacteria bacterium]|nr:DegT/DnrJ/EryC1/StrS family aminotransferase [Actinomycetota bacterium]
MPSPWRASDPRDTDVPGPRPWLPPAAAARESELLDRTELASLDEIARRLDAAVLRNRTIHELECVNLNPATNTMNPDAEAALASRLGTRPSLGHPGDKYEMGLEAIEEIEVMAAELARRVFRAPYVELRVGSGALANLYAFMATCRAGDTVIVPPPAIAGHVTHQPAGAAGLYGVEIVEAPIDPSRYSVDVTALAELAARVRPRLITIGGSLNLRPHPVREIRAIADDVGAYVLFDAAHLAGLIAGDAWPNPLEEGAHLLSMSTYKSLAGPPSGLLATSDEALARRVDAIAYPGMTANFDAGKTAALAITLLDWLAVGDDHAAAMVAMAAALAEACLDEGLPVHTLDGTATTSHAFAIEAARWGGGQAMARRLRDANLLTSGIGLPVADVPGDLNGLRVGTPELVRWGVVPEHAPELAGLLARALADEPATVAADVTRFRQRFRELRFLRPS